MTRRIYPRPPIVEAIAEFAFRGAGLNETARSAFAGQLASSYAGRRWRQKDLVLRATATPTSVGSSATQVDGPEFLVNADETRVIGVAHQGLSVHVLAPYPGWEAFLEAIQEAVGMLPPSVVEGDFGRVALRYIDQFTFDGGLDALPDFVTIAPSVKGVGAAPRRLHVFHEFAGDHEDETATLLLAAESVTDATTSVVLDLTLTSMRTVDEHSPAEPWSDSLDRMHVRQREIFEASITDATRELFV